MKQIRAQIMLVTILVITILAILTVGVVSTAVQNVRQSVSTLQNEQILNAGESRLLDFVDQFADVSVPLTAVTALPECSPDGANQYLCQIVDESGIANAVIVRETNTIQGLELAKDQGYDGNLYDAVSGTGYLGLIELAWQGEGALELILYYELAGELISISDVLDVEGLFDPALGDPLNQAALNHPFNFSYNPAADKYSFNIAAIDGLPPAAVPQSLRVVVRRSQPGAVNLDLNGDASLPLQVREFVVSSTSAASPTVTKVRTLIPLLPSLPSFAYSALQVDGQVRK